MGAYYSIALCGGLSAILAFSAFLQGREIQAVFLLVFTILCSIIAVFFKLSELNENIIKLLERNKNEQRLEN